MALKYMVDTLDGMSPAVREHYTKADDGKFRLTLDGGHPDTARVAEFRETNIGLQKQVTDLTTKFDGVDPAAVKANAAKLAEYESAKPNDKIAALESQLADANKRANGAVLKDAVVGAFLKAGGHPSAADFILTKADGKFSVENGAVVGSVFDPARPGEKLTVDAFIQQHLSASAFAFRPSSGSGADARRSGSGGGSRSGVLVIKNPTPQQLGQHGEDARERKVKFEYD